MQRGAEVVALPGIVRALLEQDFIWRHGPGIVMINAELEDELGMGLAGGLA